MRDDADIITRLKRGRFYKLLWPVGPAPAGIYRFEGVTERGLELSFGCGRDNTVSVSPAEAVPVLVAVAYRRPVACYASTNDVRQT
jgi:hypothetical protein